MFIELSSEIHSDDGLFYENLYLPATDGEIQDVLQKIRAFDKGVNFEINVLDCIKLPELSQINIEDVTLGELNIFAKRLYELSDEDVIKLNGLFNYKMENEWCDDEVSISELINITYALDSVMIASNVCDDEQLGEFVIENDLDENISELSDEVKILLDREKVGKLWRENQNGVYVDNFFIATACCEIPKIYLNDESYDSRYENLGYVFRLEVAEAQSGDEDNRKIAYWIELPMDCRELSKYKDCVYYGYETAIPHINRSMVKNLNYLPLLNNIAEEYQKMDTNDRIKYKALLSSERVDNFMDALLFSQILDKYEITDTPFEENHFFRNYLQNNADIEIDMRWFRENSFAQQSMELVKSLGAKITDYGVISAYGEPLYKSVPRYAEKEVSRTMPERFELVEVAGQKALFSNGRIENQEIPKGLHKYELRDDGSGEISSLEHSVMINCAGTVITKEPVYFGNSDFVSLEGDSAINYLGDEMTAEEFAAEDFSQDEDETIEMKM